MELHNVTPSEVSFGKKLFVSKFSAIFLVTVRKTKCVMKVASQATMMHLLSYN